MRVVVGFKAHSGWAALVAIGGSGEQTRVIERRRIELAEPATLAWAKQPYHAAQELPPEEARTLVDRGVESAHRVALQEMRGVAQRMANAGHEIIGCGIVSGPPLPPWTTEQILAVHIRMHKAEGALFPAALARAAGACGLNPVLVLKHELNSGDAHSSSPAAAARTLATLGKSVGPPWGADQKSAALAAMIVLRQFSHRSSLILND
jgi:hypothetical protein